MGDYCPLRGRGRYLKLQWTFFISNLLVVYIPGLYLKYLYALPVKKMYSMCAYKCLLVPRDLETYRPTMDMKTYIQVSASYGKIYRKGEPTDLWYLYKPI